MSLLGIFRIARRDGSELPLRGQKARAILAMLASGQNLSRSRAWLMDRLWSDRGAEQASGSLRQSLREIRKALGPDKDALVADQSLVGLDGARFWIDILDQESLRKPVGVTGEQPEFLHGIDIKDPEFENWIRDQRRHFEQVMSSDAGSHGGPADHAPPAIIRAEGKGSDQKRQLFADLISENVCRSIGEAGTVTIIEFDETGDLGVPKSNVTLKLDSSAFKFGASSGARFKLTNFSDLNVLWNASRPLGPDAPLSLEQVEILRLINETVNRTLNDIAVIDRDKYGGQSAVSLCLDAIDKMFAFDHPSLDEADNLLLRAYERNSDGVYLAWRAYLRTFILGEQSDVCRQTVIEEMRDLMRRSIEADPDNSLVLALNAYMQSMWLLDHTKAIDQAERSVEINPSNPIALAYLGIINSHIGNFEEGHRLTMRALNISGPGAHRCQLEHMACSAAAYAGHYDEAVALGENLLSTTPNYGASLRLLCLLYAYRGEHEKSQQVVENLKVLEPGFSIDLMKEQYYRSELIRKSELMECL